MSVLPRPRSRRPAAATRPGPAWPALVLLAAGCAACSPGDAARGDTPGRSDAARGAPSPDAPFSEVAAEAGLDFVHFNGMSGEFYMAENVGAGCALFDYDGDGDLDVYLVQGGLLGPGKTMRDAVFPWSRELPPRDRLFRNDLAVDANGRPRLRFVDVTEASGILATGYGMGVAAGDYDNDGHVDLYVMNLGPNQLWRNRGDGTFEDVTLASGTGDPLWSVSGAFFDYDRDGLLDLFVANYLNYNFDIDKDCHGALGAEDYCGPDTYPPLPDRLYGNRGDGTFEDVTAASRIASEPGAGLGVVVADFDNDGWLDVYVANDGLPNACWRNGGDGTFRNTALLAGCAVNVDGKEEASMGVDAADFDEDGDEDLFMAHLHAETNTLYVNDGRGNFDDRSSRSRLGPPSRDFTGFGAGWLDYDNDGLLDLLVVNGAVKTIEALARQRDPYPLHQINQLFRHEGGGVYREVTAEAGPAFRLSEVSRGAAFGDVDNDGDVDVLVTNNAGPVRLLRNEIGNRNHWLGLRMVDATGIRDVPGTRVAVRLPGGRTLWRRVRAGTSYASAGDPRVLVGLGDGTAVLEVEARWPDGRTERWSAPAIDRYHVLRQGSGSPLEAP